MQAKITGKTPKVPQIPQVTFTIQTGMIVQVLSLMAVAGTQLLHVVPEEYRQILTTMIALLQAVVGLASHYSNPDGTPAADPWNGGPPVKVVADGESESDSASASPASMSPPPVPAPSIPPRPVNPPHPPQDFVD